MVQISSILESFYGKANDVILTGVYERNVVKSVLKKKYERGLYVCDSFAESQMFLG